VVKLPTGMSAVTITEGVRTKNLNSEKRKFQGEVQRGWVKGILTKFGKQSDGSRNAIEEGTL